MMITPQMDIENTLDIVMLHLNPIFQKIDITKNNARLIAFNELVKYGIDKFHNDDSNIIISTLVENTMNSMITYNLS